VTVVVGVVDVVSLGLVGLVVSVGLRSVVLVGVGVAVRYTVRGACSTWVRGTHV
jgi:hypothetical protein